MTELVFGRADVRVMLWHLAAYGLAGIVNDAGFADVRLRWEGTVQPRPVVEVGSSTVKQIAEAVHAHASHHASAASWVGRDVVLAGKARGLMSPRLSTLPDDAAWRNLQEDRHAVLQDLTGERRWLDLALLACLGEPAYWSRNRQGQPLQDDGAHRAEMQPRNQGSELVGSRLRPLAAAVAARPVPHLLDAVLGGPATDEIGAGRADSRTGTGLAPPGPTDNAVAWCALWGLSQLPSAARVDLEGNGRGTAASAAHLGRRGEEWFYLPVWFGPLRPARLRSLLSSAQLATVATVGLPPRWAAADPARTSAAAWLRARGVAGVVRFPVATFGSASAPERRAMNGLTITVGTV